MTKKLWVVLSFLICGLISIPILTIIFHVLEMRIDMWTFLWETGLVTLVLNSLGLVIGVGVGTFLLGTSLAWLVVMYRFPGARLFEGALLLPLAVPGYVIGFVFLSQWDYTGTIPSLLRQVFGQSIWIPDFRSYIGVVFVLTLVLYPYVYLLARSAFRRLNYSLIEAAINLKKTRKELFWKIGLPMARPSIAVGVMLVLMETLADFGTVELFSYDTFTTSIYQLWFGLFDKNAAIQLSGVLLIFVTILFYLEHRSRGMAGYVQVTGSSKPFPAFQLKGKKAIVATCYPALVLIMAFIIPVFILARWVVLEIIVEIDDRYFEILKNTILVGVGASTVVLFVALFFAYGRRLFPGKLTNFLTRMSTFGYALPGSVIAVGALVPLAFADHLVNYFSETMINRSVGLIFTGSLFGLIFAYTVRFLTIPFNSIASNLSNITPNMDKAAFSLGATVKQTLFRVHFPLIRGGMVTGFIIVFVDVMKEMPATLLLRPFGFNTLSTRIWELTAEAYWEDAALPALTIVMIALIPVFMLIGFGKKVETYS